MKEPAIKWARKASHEELIGEVCTLTARVMFLLETHITRDPVTGGFTFPDGDFWEMRDPEDKGGWQAAEDDGWNSD